MFACLNSVSSLILCPVCTSDLGTSVMYDLCTGLQEHYADKKSVTCMLRYAHDIAKRFGSRFFFS